MAKVPRGVKILPKISIAWVGCTNVTDDRQTTDGRTTTYSEHELEFTFANNRICQIHTQPFPDDTSKAVTLEKQQKVETAEGSSWDPILNQQYQSTEFRYLKYNAELCVPQQGCCRHPELSWEHSELELLRQGTMRHHLMQFHRQEQRVLPLVRRRLLPAYHNSVPLFPESHWTAPSSPPIRLANPINTTTVYTHYFEHVMMHSWLEKDTIQGTLTGTRKIKTKVVYSDTNWMKIYRKVSLLDD